ncbi:MAG: CDP-glycerol glycerophosphotransferase family protein [Candidatus Saccharimonadales bacterium]
MKFDKKNPLHWLYLVGGAIAVVVTLPARIFKSFREKPLVVLYGHKLNGNLKAFYDYVSSMTDPEFRVVYLTMDPVYYKQLKKQGVDVMLNHNPLHMFHVSQADVMMTDHGYHSIYIYYRWTSMKFVDVWHGIPYKGYTPSNFVAYQNYAGIWTSSPTLRKAYVNDFKLNDNIVKVTGYARIDPLVNDEYNLDSVREKYGIPTTFKKVVLLAPTWRQDDAGRSIIPFDLEISDFFNGLNDVASKSNTLIIFRAHLNSGDNIDIAQYENIKIMPYARYPVAEDFLAISDVLISDWSSIVFDYLPLRRPTIFLDVPSPFKDGFTVKPKYRFGEIVASYQTLLSSLEEYLERPDVFREKYKAIMSEANEVVYGDTADGRSSERYVKELKRLIGA